MKIKSLQMHGFKSFGDKTEITFDRQIVGVVGPNGCGKSNIVDAIRWVMGEQSAKGLRGNEMSDVIFGGTATRKKGAFAEVSLTFDNTSKLAPAPYTDCAEIMITRRLYRSGESEYLINKVAVRLKDITDLFLGTGSSAKAYSIVAQGKIDQIVLAKPEDRRGLLEEAAGIAKYKVRKVSAERKMEATRGNLARVHDIIQELERSAKHLERQVGRAEQFRKLQTELRKLDEQIVGAKVVKLDKAASENNKIRETSQIDFEKVAAELAELEASIERLRLESLHQEKIATSDYETLIGLKERFSSADKEMELSAQRVSLLRNQIDERKRDIERIQAKSLATFDAMNQVSADREKLEAEQKQKHEGVAVLKEELGALERRVSEKEQSLVELQRTLDEQKTATAREQQKREMLQADRVSLELRRAELERSIDELSSQVQALDENIRLHESEQAELGGLKASQENLLKELEQKHSASIEKQSDLFSRRTEAQATLGTYEAEIKSLQTLEEHSVGYDLGAMERKNKTGEPLVMDLLKFKSEFSSAGEAFLYEFGQCFVSENTASLSSDADSSRWSAMSALSSTDSAFPGTLARTLESAVEGEAPLALRNILKSIELVDVLAPAAGHIQIDVSGRMRMPLGSGLFLESLGLVRKKETPFGRRHELEHYEGLRAAQLQTIQSIDAEIELLSNEIEAIASQIENLRGEIRNTHSKDAQLQARFARLQGQREALVVKQDQFRLEIEQSDLKISEITRQLAADMQTTAAEVEHHRTRLLGELSEIQEKKLELDSRWIEERIALGALNERLERLKEQTVHVELTRSEYEHNQGMFAQDVSLWTADIEKETAKVGSLRSQSSEDQAAIKRLEMKLAENKEALTRVRGELEQMEVRRKDVAKAKESAQEILQQQELTLQRLKFEVDELSNLVSERYHVSLQDILAACTPADLERLEDETVLGALEVEAQEIRERIEKFGDVNLLALTEFEEIKNRLTFMNQQREDLLKTLDALQGIIDRINKITEFRFRETFKAINHNFQILFPKLFGGGRAYMTLTDESNLLETGVEIFAEPPGKKVQAMSLLSGGEKAMTSISLLFALFAYRPASFCILDEVDAPLDEINTMRYNSIIQDMSSLSQFIVITHNKRTMEIVDTLFGVTMQEPGVSQMVGVQLQEAKAFVASQSA